MTTNKCLVLVMAALLLSIFIDQQTGVAHSSFDKLLTVSDVEKVTGLKGSRLVPKDYSKMMFADLNFVQQDGTLLLKVNFWDLRTFETAKGGYPYKVDGVGDEAFEGPTGTAVHEELIFRKGDRAVVLSSALDPKKNKPLLSEKQLRELAKVIASRM